MELQRVAVIGAGTMGHGIAQVAAVAGYDVTLVDTAADVVHRGLDRLTEALGETERRGKITAQEREAALRRIGTSTDAAAAVRDCDLVIEAVPEKLDLKIELLTTLERAASTSCLLASNTSSLSINDMQQQLKQPQRMLGLHFFNPVPASKLVEIVRGSATSDETLQAANGFVARLGKEAIMVKDSPGFATSRLGVLLGLEAMRMLEEGVASAEDIDKALELGYRHPMGPLKLTDMVGLDVRLDIAKYLHEKLGGERFRPPRILEEMVAAGKLGRKSGEGFYRW